MHDWPHAHQRQAVVGFPYKQALRPSQHYDPDSGAGCALVPHHRG
jgi:hypothetical protein